LVIFFYSMGNGISVDKETILGWPECVRALLQYWNTQQVKVKACLLTGPSMMMVPSWTRKSSTSTWTLQASATQDKEKQCLWRSVAVLLATLGSPVRSVFSNNLKILLWSLSVYEVLLPATVPFYVWFDCFSWETFSAQNIFLN
jgi:hypothetical protein